MSDKQREIAVGDKLYFVPREQRMGMRACWKTVAKIGRVWITFEGFWGERADKERLIADGGDYASPGRYYRSVEEYEADKSRTEAWADLIASVRHRYRCPEHLTLEDITAIRDRLTAKEPQ